MKNLDILLKGAKIIAINLTHLQQSNLCNHAFAIQLTAAEPFYPRGNGLSDDRRKVIQGMFDRNICVDLKHMSYKSRVDLRQEMEVGRYRNAQPPICSHTGFTGTSFAQWSGFISLKKPLNDVYYLEVAKTMQTENGPQRPGAPAFNMTTINLFDEEIVWIVKTGGMIGLSLDRRIIGYVSKFDERPTGISTESALFVDKEFISKDEWNALQVNNEDLGSKIEDGDCVTQDDIEESTESSIPARNEYFFDHVLLHLKDYFQVCYKAGISIEVAKRHITIGSDYDGFINPFINVATVKDLPELKKYISTQFKYYLETLIDSREWVEQLDIGDFVEDLFFNNGYNFIKQCFYS